jgi:two-component system, LytTR family, sensor kinase
MALRLQVNDKTKALKYLINYQALSDSINEKLDRLMQSSRDIETGGYQNMLRIEVLQKDKEMSDKTMVHLMNESDLQKDVLGSQKTLIYLLCAVLLIGLFVLFYIIRVSKQRRIANQQLALRSLRSQMNPHFIFNALNSVNSFISTSDERSANRFLTEFSTLMRTVMENSEYDFISLTKELEIIKIYAELEHFRFNDKFSYQLNVDDNLDIEGYMLPPMLIQPYIENAIWHGLRYKETKGELIISFLSEEGKLKITIQDDGIGRQKSKEIKTKNQKLNKSTALKNINAQVKLFGDLHKIKIEVLINDLHEDGSGTVVSLLIPQINHG